MSGRDTPEPDTQPSSGKGESAPQAPGPPEGEGSERAEALAPPPKPRASDRANGRRASERPNGGTTERPPGRASERPRSSKQVPTSPPRSRLRRVAGGLLTGAVSSVVFASASVAGFALHLDLPASRRVLMSTIGSLYDYGMQGRLEVVGLRHLSPRHLEVDELHLYDGANREVVTMTGVRVRADLVTFAYDALFGGEKTTLVINHIRAERTMWHIIPDTDGTPTLVSALSPIPSEPSASPSSSGGRYIRVWIPVIELGQSFVRGQIGDLPTAELSLSSARGSLLATPKGLAIDVQRFGATLRGFAGADAVGTGDFHIRSPGPLWSNFNGHLGDVQLGAFFKINGGRFETRIDLPKAEPESVRALFADWPLHEPISARVDASGELPKLETKASMTIGDAKLEATGPIRLGDDLGADLDIKATDLDLKSLFPEAPETSIDTRATIEIWNRAGDVVVDINGRTEATAVAGFDVPMIDWNASYDKSGFRGKSVIHETGVPMRGDFHLHPEGSVDLELRARRFALVDSPRLRPHARGFLDITAKGTIDKGQLKASVSATGEQLTISAVQLASARLEGSVSGPLAKPEAMTVSSTLKGGGFRAAGLVFEDVSGSARGRLLQPNLKATLSGEFRPKIVAQARLSPPLNGQKRTRLSKLEVSVRRDEVELLAKAEQLDITGGRVALQDLVLSGAGGDLSASATLTGGDLKAKLSGTDVDLSAISHAIGLPKRTLDGRLTIDANVSLAGDESKGKVVLALGDASVMGVEGISVNMSGELNRLSFDGRGQGQVKDIGAVGAKWHVVLAGDPALAKSWVDGTGNGQIDARELNLTGLVLELRKYGVDSLDGKAAVRVDVQRSDPAHLPSMFFTAGTTGLDVKYRTANKDEEKRQAYHLSGMDFETSGVVNGTTGESQAAVSLKDQHGTLLALGASLKLELRRLLQSNAKQAAQLLSNTPVDARLVFPERSLAKLPPEFRPEGLDGILEGEIRARGSLSSPTLEAVIFSRGMRPKGSRLAQPFDTTIRGRYDATSGDFDANAELSVKQRRVAVARTSGNAAFESIKAGRPLAEDWWSIGATLKLEDLPLQAFAPFADDHIGASLRGSMSAQRQRGRPLVVASIEIRDPVLDRVPLGQGSISFRSDGENAQATLRLDDGKGKLEATLRTGLEWVALLPTLDQRDTIRVDLSATNYDAVVVQPFVNSLFSQVGGRVDGRFRTVLRREERVASGEQADGAPEKAWSATVEGNASVREGLLQITTLGLTLEDVRLNLTATGDGLGTSISLSGLKGKVRSDKDNIEGNAQVRLTGLELTRGQGWLRINGVPLLLEGVSQGTGSGYATFRMERIEEGMKLDVSIPRLEARLPRSSSRSVYTVEDNPDIQVVQLLKEPSKSSDEKPTLWLVPIKLGNEVRITRSDMEVYIRGEPVLRIEDKTTLEGFIEVVPGGRIPALGKAFVIERGTVSFDTGDATDPHLNATASWRAADNTTVFVDVTGTLKKAELSLRSDPPLPEPEIIALMLGGVSTTGEAQQTPGGADDAGGGTTDAAVNIGGGVAAIGLNELLADTPLGGVELRTDTTSKAAPSYTAAYRASSKVYFEGTYQTADNSGIDDTVKEGFTGTVDYRFLPNWSLRTQVGNTGTALDLIWQYRY